MKEDAEQKQLEAEIARRQQAEAEARGAAKLAAEAGPDGAAGTSTQSMMKRINCLNIAATSVH